MAVVTLQTPINVGNPEARKRMVREAVCQLDEWTALFRCAADSAACASVEEELVASLYKIHGELKKQVDTLTTLT
jgi:hypothetical protein